MEEKDDFWANVESEQDNSIPSMMISDNQAAESVMITGMPQQITGTQHQMILMQQPSSAPRVIGIFVIIWGALQILFAISGPFINDALSNVSQVDSSLQLFDYLLAAISILFGLGFIYSGYLISERQKLGVRIAWGLIAVGLVINILVTIFGPMPEAPEGQELDETVYLGITIGGQLFCNAICGLMVAIPLMANNTLMEPLTEEKTGTLEWSNEVLKGE